MMSAELPEHLQLEGETVRILDDSYDSAEVPSDSEEGSLGQGSPCPQSPSPSPVDDHERNWVASQDESNFSDFTGGSPEVDTSAEIDLGAEAPVILITTVDIGEGRSGQIEVRAGENTTQVAKRFCLEHGLPEQVVVPLSKHLLDNLSNLAGIQQHGDDRRAKKGKPKPQKPAPQARRSARTVRRSAPAVQIDAKRQSAVGGSKDYLGRMYRSTDEQPVQVWVERRKPSSRSPPQQDEEIPVHERLYAMAQENERRRQRRGQELQAEADAELQSQRESIGWVSKELAAHREVGEYLNYGELLYVEGIVERDRRAKIAEARRQEEAMEEMQEATFTPAISRMAKEICRPRNMSTWERLSNGYSNQKQMLEAKKLIQKQEDEAKQVVECSFHPVINRNSKQLMSKRTEVLREHQITAHEQLFQDAIRRQLRQDEYSSWYPEEVTFQPSTNPPDAWKRTAAAASRASVRQSHSSSVRTSAESAGSSANVEVWAGRQCSPGTGSDSQQGSSCIPNNAGPKHPSKASSLAGTIPKETPAFAQRLYAHKDELARKAAERAAKEALTFKPKTGRAPAPGYGRNLQGRSIGDYLYGKHHEIEGKKEYLGEQRRREEEQARCMSHMSSMSETLMEKLKKRRFGQIFSFLDAGNEGALDLVGIALSESEALEQLDTEVRADVVEAARLLQARRDAFARRCALDQTMSADEIPEVLLVDSEGFAALMEEVLRNSKGCPRPYLQPAPVSSRTEVPEYNYKPEMAPKSKELAAKRRPVNVPAHQVLLQEWEQSRHKREMEKAAKEMAEMAECTFEPQFISEPLASHGRALRLSQMLFRGSAESDDIQWIKPGSPKLRPSGSTQSPRDNGVKPPRRNPMKRTTRDSKAGASTEQGATLMELAGTVTHLDEGRVGSDPRLDSTEEMLKHLGDTDAAEFRNMERELQQILMQATDDEVLRLGTPGTGNTAVARGKEAGQPLQVKASRTLPLWNLENVLATDSEEDVTPKGSSIQGWDSLDSPAKATRTQDRNPAAAIANQLQHRTSSTPGVSYSALHAERRLG